MRVKKVHTVGLFYPRGGSAQVIRYLLLEMRRRGQHATLAVGSLGGPGRNSEAATFYDPLPVDAFNYNRAQAQFEAGGDSQGANLDRPFHPSFEDRGISPDPIFSSVSPTTAQHLENSWRNFLGSDSLRSADLVHLHHLSHLQKAVAGAAPKVPVVTTLHGTELKLLHGMKRHLELSTRTGATIAELASRYASAPHRQHLEAIDFATSDDEVQEYRSVDWSKWVYSTHWTERLREAVELAGRLVVISRHDQVELQRLLDIDPETVTVIGNGVDLDHFTNRNFTADEKLERMTRWLVSEPLGWKAGLGAGSIAYTGEDIKRMLDEEGNLRPVIFWCGRFLRFKRIDTLLAGFATALDRAVVKPVLIMWGGYPGEYEGEHPYDTAVRLGIERSVFFIGWRGHDLLPEGLSCSDLMVAPAEDEPFGMVYLEAMACGVAPVATRSGGPDQIIDADSDQADGWKVHPGDSEELAEVILAAITDNQARRARQEAARAKVEAQYSWPAVVDKYSEVYDIAIDHFEMKS